MASIVIEEFTKIDFVISVDDIENLKLLESKQLRLRDQTWTITFTKSNQKLTKESNEDVLAIDLNLKNDNNIKSNDWAIVATFSAKTIQSKNFNKSRKQITGPVVFNSKNIAWRQVFITWKDLIDPANGFIDENGCCRFKIKIKSSPTHNVASDDPVKFETNRKCCDDGTYGKFRLTVKNLSTNFGVTSPEIHLNKIPWRIVLVKDEKLRVLLRNMNVEENLSWSCSTKVECSMMSFDTNINPITKQLNKTDPTVSSLEIFSITWNDLENPAKQYLQNGAFVLDIEMKINHPEQAVKCPICSQCMIGRDVVSTSCGHLFCKVCLGNVLSKYYLLSDKYCPKCHGLIKISDNRKITL